jgi:hypothetical protein
MDFTFRLDYSQFGLASAYGHALAAGTPPETLF